MRFFLPDVPDDNVAGATWERMRESCGSSENARPLFSITYDEGTEVVAMVGEKGGVAIIFGGEAFYIFEAASRGPVPWRRRLSIWTTSIKQRGHDIRRVPLEEA